MSEKINNPFAGLELPAEPAAKTAGKPAAKAAKKRPDLAALKAAKELALKNPAAKLAAAQDLVTAVAAAIYAGGEAPDGGYYAAVTVNAVKRAMASRGWLARIEQLPKLVEAGLTAGILIPAVCFRYTSGISLAGLAEYCRKPKAAADYSAAFDAVK